MDMPMRTYSSGMYGRLAFSVAVNMDPDILLIDEALSVGDARFRRKSFDKMRELCEQDRTIVLVTTRSAAIEELCDQAIWMHKGELRMWDEPDAVDRRLHGVPRGRRGRAHDGGRLTQPGRRDDAASAPVLVERRGSRPGGWPSARGKFWPVEAPRLRACGAGRSRSLPERAGARPRPSPTVPGSPSSHQRR